MFFAPQAEPGLASLQAMVLPTGFQLMERGTQMVKGKHESFRVSKTGKMAVGRYLAYDEVQVHPRAAATQARVIVIALAMLLLLYGLGLFMR